MLDGDVTSAWGSGVAQAGNEELVIDLGGRQTVGGIEMRMGSYSFGHAKYLQVATSVDGQIWTDRWAGSLGALTVRAALQDPSSVPIAIELPPVTARFVRLRQTGIEPSIPLWVAELRVHGVVNP